MTMNKPIMLLAAILLTAGAATSQVLINPQIGITYQNLTDPAEFYDYKAATGFQAGADLRFGDRFFFQPGAFFGRNVTVVSVDNGETAVVEDGLVRTNLKFRAQAGYKIIDNYQFDLRVMLGPSYDVLLSVDNKDDKIEWNKGDFNGGSRGMDAGIGFDMGYFTVSPTVSFGLSRVFDDDVIELKDIDSKYLTYGLTLGWNFGNDD